MHCGKDQIIGWQAWFLQLWVQGFGIGRIATEKNPVYKHVYNVYNLLSHQTKIAMQTTGGVLAAQATWQDVSC
jgi:hypothetical protein